MPNFRLKDTFDLRGIRMSRDEDDTVSSVSSIRELSKTDELRMKRSFRAIQGKEETDFGASGLDRTLRTEPITPEYSSQYMPSRFRGPDDRRPIITDSDDEARSKDSIDGPSIDDTDEEEIRPSQDGAYINPLPGPSADLSSQIDRLTTTAKTVSWDAEGLMTRTTTLEGVHVIPTATRESTPDSTMHSGQTYIKGMASPFQQRVSVPGANAAELGETMRGHLLNNPESGQMDQLDPITNRQSVQDEQYQADEKESCRGQCWWRGIIFIAIVGILVAGIVAIVVYFRPPASNIVLGTVFQDPITYRECEDKTFVLGDTLTFTCVIDIEHIDRRIFTNATTLRIESPTESLVPDVFTWNKTTLSEPTRQSWIIKGTRVTCSSVGIYKINFIDPKNVTVGQLEFRATVSAPIPETSIKQLPIGQTDKTVFELTCTVNNDCFNYVPSFIGLLGGNREKNLNHNRSCTVTVDPQKGYSTVCTGQYSESLIAPFSYLNCRLQSGNRVQTINKEFELPNCTNNCNPESTRPYNCSLKSDFRLALDTCDLSIIQRQRCFDEGRSIIVYPVCPYGASPPCPEFEVTHCRLAWCRIRGRYYSEIRKEEIPGNVLCGDGFQEIIPTTPLPTIQPTPQRTVAASTSAGTTPNKK